MLLDRIVGDDESKGATLMEMTKLEIKREVSLEAELEDEGVRADLERAAARK